MVKLKETLKELMGGSGVTIKVLAERTGVPMQTLHNWLCGQTPRNVSQVKSVASYFEVSVDYLLFQNSAEVRIEGIPPIPDGDYEVVLRPIRKGLR